MMIKIQIVSILIISMLISGCNNEETTLIKKFPPFMTRDLNNQVVTSNIFADKKITMVTIWTTNIPDCREFLMQLHKLSDDDVQVIGIVGDVKRNNLDKKYLEIAKNITTDFPDDFLNLIVVNDLNDLLVSISTAPTTIFVDSQGNIIGQPVTVNNVELIHRELNRLIEMNSTKTKDMQQIQDVLF